MSEPWQSLREYHFDNLLSWEEAALNIGGILAQNQDYFDNLNWLCVEIKCKSAKSNVANIEHYIPQTVFLSPSYAEQDFV